MRDKLQDLLEKTSREEINDPEMKVEKQTDGNGKVSYPSSFRRTS